jgi:hypothetical protein
MGYWKNWELEHPTPWDGCPCCGAEVVELAGCAACDAWWYEDDPFLATCPCCGACAHPLGLVGCAVCDWTEWDDLPRPERE